MYKGVKNCICPHVSKNVTAWLLLGGVLQVALINVSIYSSVFLTLYNETMFLLLVYIVNKRKHLMT